jgi:hypothetical protein
MNSETFWNLNLISIFKWFKYFGKTPINSQILYLVMACTNIILDNITCIEDFKVPLQVAFEYLEKI